jgi:hypothetical protein
MGKTAVNAYRDSHLRSCSNNPEALAAAVSNARFPAKVLCNGG